MIQKSPVIIEVGWKKGATKEDIANAQLFVIGLEKSANEEKIPACIKKIIIRRLE